MDRYSFLASVDAFAAQLENPTWFVWRGDAEEDYYISSELRHSIIGMFADLSEAVTPIPDASADIA